MPPLKFCLTFALALPLTAAHASAAAHHGDGASSTVTLHASVDLPGEPSILVFDTVSPNERAQPVSSGTTASLPEIPVATANVFMPATANTSRVQYMPAPAESANAKLPDEPGMLSLVEASPIGGVARRIQAQRFNTDDGVSSNDFAICYRLNSRSSVQVIPGDPAPVKIPVSGMANNAGVTVGMVVRLSR